MLNWLDAVPALVRILLVFAWVLLAIKRRWTLGSAFVSGAVLLGLLFAMGPLAILQAAGRALIHPKTLSLTVIVSLILVLSHSLEKSGQMARLLNTYRGLIRWPQLNLVVFPALIGLLPMPGGAVFSAPMVKNLGRDLNLSDARLSYINYWFRHIWEYWWPLYPGILLTTALAEINLWRMVAFTFPLTVVAVVAGYWPLRGALRGEVAQSSGKTVGPFIKELAPIVFVIVGGLALGMVFSRLMPSGGKGVAKELGLILALLLAIGWVWQANAMPRAACWAILRQPELLKMIYMVGAILVFKGVLEDGGAVKALSEEMLRWRIPLTPIAVLLPFVVGLVAGITIAFVGATFPILISLIHALGQAHLMLPYMMLALASGFVGVLVSPLHLCLLLSNAYFQTKLVPVYRLMVVPLIALLISGSVYFGLAAYWID